MVVFVLLLLLSGRWASHQALSNYNVLFDSDPSARAETMAHGWTRPKLKHPLYHFAFSVPLRVLSGGLSAVGLVSDQESFRERLIPGIAPLLMALKTLLFFLCCRYLGLTPWLALLAAVGCAASFSQLVFGSIPEHLSATAFLVALLFLWMVRSLQDSRWDRTWMWVLIGVMLISITLTNAAVFGGGLLALRWIQRGRLRPALRDAVPPVALACGLTVGLFFLLSALRGDGERTENLQTEMAAHCQSSFADSAARFPRAAFLTILAVPPQVMENSLAVELDAAVKIQFTYERDLPGLRDWCLGLLCLAVSTRFGLRALRGPPAWRMVALAAGTMLLFNLTLHICWGGEWFLYSQHWHVPLMLLLAAALGPGVTRLRSSVFASGVVVVGTVNTWVLARMLQQLPA